MSDFLGGECEASIDEDKKASWADNDEDKKRDEAEKEVLDEYVRCKPGIKKEKVEA